MPLSWHLERQHLSGEGEVAILHLRGFLGDDALARFGGAVGWAERAWAGPLIFNAVPLLGASAKGLAALWEAAGQVAASGRVTAICVAPAHARSRHGAEGAQEFGVFEDLTRALACLNRDHRPGAPA